MPSLQSPHALLNEAAHLQNAGNFTEAADCYERLLAEWPDLPNAWYNFGHVQRMRGRYEDALAAYEEALRRGIERPEDVHLNRAVIFADHLRREELAERELHAALMCNSRFVPALLNLAGLHEDLGHRDEARTLYASALATDPGCLIALARLAELSIGTGSDDAMIAPLREAIARPNTAAADQAELGFALGTILDARGRYDEAFAAYSAANRAGRKDSPAYDRRGHERFIDDIIKIFPAGAAAPATPSSPIFICGMFRSGSTLTEQVLAMHPGVTSGGEVNFFSTLMKGALSPFPAAAAKADYAALAARYREYLRGLFPEAGRITDKKPDNYLVIGLIKRMFPDARIVHTIRNPLDTCISVFFQHINRPYASDLGDTAHYFRQYRRLMAHWKSLYGQDILDFDYDGFVRDPKPATERLLAFCGLAWNDNCLQFHRAKNAVKTASVWQVRQPLYNRSSGRWSHYEAHLKELRDGLSGLI